jgi:DNA-binding CsgD family transcriptional regulator
MGGVGESGDVLLERDRELERIGWCLKRAQEGHGSALVVEGPAGIGKTALLARARDTAQDEGIRVLRARGAELEREFAFSVVRQLVEPVLAAASEAERASLLDGPPAVAARLLGLPGLAEGRAAAPPVAPDPSFAALHGLYWLCVNLAAERPLALVVDDAHWADGASLRFLAFVLPRLEELRVAVLMGARSAEAGESQDLLAALTMDPATEVVTLRPLTTAAVARLVAMGLGVEPDDDFVAACRAATGGTPFLVHTLVETLREERIAPVAASASKVQGLASATLDRWAMLRLGQLGPEATRLARAVSVLGRADLAHAGRLAGLAPSEAATAAQLLVRAGVLEQAPLAFAHPLLRASIYNEIDVTERADTHVQAARLLADGHKGAARVAEHLLVATPTGDAWVVQQLRVAAREATAAGAPESAAAYLRRALAEPPSPDAEAGTLRELGVAELSAGQPGWQGHLDAVVHGAGEDTTRIVAALQLATALGLNQRFGEAVKVCDGVAASLDGRDPEVLWQLEATAVACGLLDATVAPSVADRAGALLERAREGSVPRHVLAAAAYVGALANEPAEWAADLARRAVHASPRPLPEPGDSPWFGIAIFGFVFAECWNEAQGLLDAAVAAARAAADGLFLPVVLVDRAWLGLRRSDLTAAEADARALLEAPALSAPLLSRLLATGVLVDALVERGELDQAEHALEPVAADLQTTSQMAGVLRHARGRLRFAQRRLGEALDDFRAAGEIATRARAVSPCYLPWRSDAALVELALGNAEGARQLSEEELELARAFGAPRTLGVALRAAALVAGGQRGEALLREAIEVLGGPDTRLEQARARADLGAVLRRSNRRVEAREMLRQAVDAAHRVGAEPLAGVAETELRATGARPRRVMLTGLEALTASERRIAELAAEGLTNAQIAQTLFVTARTVEGHLTNVFLKLDVKARIELPAALVAPTQAVPT